MNNLNIIAAIGKNNELGYQNNLIWHIEEDLQFFKRQTMNSYIIMGRKTYESLPRRLVDRKYIVITSNNNIEFPNFVIKKNSVEDVLSMVYNNKNQFYVIGGGLVYESFINYADVMYLTEINSTFVDATVYFPKFNKKDWYLEKGLYLKEDNIFYSHNKYTRKKVRRNENV